MARHRSVQHALTATEPPWAIRAHIVHSASLLPALALSWTLAAWATSTWAAESDSRDDASPWGMAAGAETGTYFEKVTPLLQQAGVRWFRCFPEWQSIQPKQGEWHWDRSDRIVADARANHLHVLGIWAYFAPWASADGGTRKGPIKDMQYWRDYVSETVKRYQKDIKYWEVWNEFNGSFYEGRQGPDKVKDYAALVVSAYDTVKEIDPSIQIGMSVASLDVAFLDAAIKAGAADHFDYICVHPYENLGAVAEGREVGYLGLAGNLREMLAANKQRTSTPLWITEVGDMAPTKAEPTRDAQQADVLVKAYLLSIVQGFDRIFWFEARGPDYGGGQEFGLIRDDWSLRPSYDALKTMTSLLGPEPRYLGWLSPTGRSHCFVFQGASEPILVIWASSDQGDSVSFSSDTTVTDLAGKAAAAKAGQDLALTRAPVLVTGLPMETVAEAEANRDRPFAWLKDYSEAETVSCRMGAADVENGLTQLELGDGRTVAGLVGGDHVRRTDRASGMFYVYFDVDDSYASVGDQELEITIVARRADAAQDAGCNLLYESATGYKSQGEWWSIPAEEGWHQHTFQVQDAYFAHNWGWNFRIEVTGSPGDLWVKEVTVKRHGPKT